VKARLCEFDCQRQTDVSKSDNTDPRGVRLDFLFQQTGSGFIYGVRGFH
jgi:hypothetical protein